MHAYEHSPSYRVTAHGVRKTVLLFRSQHFESPQRESSRLNSQTLFAVTQPAPVPQLEQPEAPLQPFLTFHHNGILSSPLLSRWSEVVDPVEAPRVGMLGDSSLMNHILSRYDDDDDPLSPASLLRPSTMWCPMNSIEEPSFLLQVFTSTRHRPVIAMADCSRDSGAAWRVRGPEDVAAMQQSATTLERALINTVDSVFLMCGTGDVILDEFEAIAQRIRDAAERTVYVVHQGHDNDVLDRLAGVELVEANNTARLNELLLPRASSRGLLEDDPTPVVRRLLCSISEAYNAAYVLVPCALGPTTTPQMAFAFPVPDGMQHEVVANSSPP